MQIPLGRTDSHAQVFWKIHSGYRGGKDVQRGIRFIVPETFKKREYTMIMLTKLNDQEIVLNCAQIESVEVIPESKVVMMNGKFFIVKESAEEIIQKTIEYNKKFHYYPTDR